MILALLAIYPSYVYISTPLKITIAACKLDKLYHKLKIDYHQRIITTAYKLMSSLFHTRRKILSIGIENMLRLTAALSHKSQSANNCPAHQDKPIQYTHPEDYRPLDAAFFQNPYDFYQLLRDKYPIYQLKNGIYCISRFDDIVSICRDTEAFSSTYQGIIPGLKPHQSVEKAGKALDAVGKLGIAPSNVLALADPPKHAAERKASAQGLNTGLAKHLDDDIRNITNKLLDELIKPNCTNHIEFMEAFAWKMPMQVVMKLLGYPTEDYNKIKNWCADIISLQTGIASAVELKKYQASGLALMRYCWKQYLHAKANFAEHEHNATGIFIKASRDTSNHIDDQIAVSSIFQTIIAGSDSSATSMGNAIKMLIENPHIIEEIKADIDNKLPAFIEEVFRLEAAFQGHFRWAKKEAVINGVTLPRGSRIFLMWASANRDESIFPNPNEIDLNRENGKKHMTFGFGLHACAGRELARAEIKIALTAILKRSTKMEITGETPFVASMFTHSLSKLPIAIKS